MSTTRTENYKLIKNGSMICTYGSIWIKLNDNIILYLYNGKIGCSLYTMLVSECIDCEVYVIKEISQKNNARYTVLKPG